MRSTATPHPRIIRPPPLTFSPRLSSDRSPVSRPLALPHSGVRVTFASFVLVVLSFARESGGIVRRVRDRTWQYETPARRWLHTNGTDTIPPGHNVPVGTCRTNSVRP